MPRSSSSAAPPSAALAASAALVSALTLACGGAPGPASAEPTASSPAASASPGAAQPDGAAPPMYKPSSRSPRRMSIADPAYGAYSDARNAPTLGDTVPDFEVALADGGTFSLAEARKAGPVLVMFYRGFW